MHFVCFKTYATRLYIYKIRHLNTCFETEEIKKLLLLLASTFKSLGNVHRQYNELLTTKMFVYE